MSETEIHVSQILPGSAYQVIGTNSGATSDVYLTLAGTTNQISVGTSGTTLTLSTPLTSSLSYTLPSSRGSNGQVLTTDGSTATLSWSPSSGTVNSGTAGNLSLYATSTNAVSDTYIQNGKNITLGITTQASRTSNLVYFLQNPGNAVSSTNLLMADGTQTVNANLIFTGSGNISALPAATTGGEPVIYAQSSWSLAAGSLSGNLTLLNQSAVVFNDTEGTPKSITLEAPSTITTSYTLKLPTTAGTNNYFLQTDGSGNTTWQQGGGVGYREDYVVGTSLNNYTGSTTIFNLVNSYTVGGHTLIVTYDGVTMTPGASIDYLETNSTTVTFNNALVSGQKVSFIFSQPATSTSGNVNSGTSGQFSYYASSGTTLSGQSSLTLSGSNVSLNSNKIVNLANGTTSTDAVAFGQIKVLQTVSFTTTSGTGTSSTSFVASNLTTSITPTSSSSKIIIIISGPFISASGGQSKISLSRGGSNILGSNGFLSTGNTNFEWPVSYTYLDSPATTASTTYAVTIAASSGTVTFGDTNMTQSMLLMEVQ